VVGITLVLVLMALWTLLWLYLLAIQGLPDIGGALGDRYRNEATQFRFAISGIWLAGILVGALTIALLRRSAHRH